MFAYPKCVSCKRPIRPWRTPQADHPGTITAGGHGKCYTCTHINRRRTKNPTRPSEDPHAVLIRYRPGGYDLASGRVLRATAGKYELEINGVRHVLQRPEWMEILR